MDEKIFDESLSNAELVNRDTFERLKSKNKAKKHGRIVAYVLLAVLLCLVFIAACMALFLKIETINVNGNERYGSEEIQKASGIEIGQNLYAIDKKLAKNNIIIKYPYVKNVTIRRSLPSTLNFNIEEEKAMYYTEICGEYFALSSTLRVLERTENLEEMDVEEAVMLMLPNVSKAIVGDELVFDNEEITFDYIEKFIVDLEKNEMQKQLTGIDITDKYNIYITFENRFRIYLGDNSELGMKLTFAKMMIDNFPPEAGGQVDAHDISVGSVILDS